MFQKFKSFTWTLTFCTYTYKEQTVARNWYFLIKRPLDLRDLYQPSLHEQFSWTIVCWPNVLERLESNFRSSCQLLEEVTRSGMGACMLLAFSREPPSPSYNLLTSCCTSHLPSLYLYVFVSRSYCISDLFSPSFHEARLLARLKTHFGHQVPRFPPE